MRWQPQSAATPPPCGSCPWEKKPIISESDIIYWTDQAFKHQNAHQNSIPLTFLILKKTSLWGPLLTILITSTKIRMVRKSFSWQEPQFCTLLILSSYAHQASPEYFICLGTSISARPYSFTGKRKKIIPHSPLSFAHCKTKTNPNHQLKVV